MRVLKLSAPRQPRANRSRIMLVVGSLLVLVFVAGTIRASQRKNRVQRELAELQQQIQNFQRDNAQLEQWLGYLSSDAFVTAEARRSLGLGRPGEQPVVVVPPQTPSSAAVAVAAAAAPPPLSALWWEYFFGGR